MSYNLTVNSKMFGYNVEPVVMPKETFGFCKNHKNCRNYGCCQDKNGKEIPTWLGDGYCQRCYDKFIKSIIKGRDLGGGKK